MSDDISKLIKKITIVVEPLVEGEEFYSSSCPNPTSIYVTANYEQLAKELQEQLNIPVRIEEDFLQNLLPLNGIIMLYPRTRGFFFKRIMDDCDAEPVNELLPRLILLDVISVLEIVEQYPVAAIVQNLDYDKWWDFENHKTEPLKQGIFCLYDVAIEAEFDVRSRSGEYCMAHGRRLQRLPAMLVDYLEAYIKVVPKIDTLQ